MCLIRLLVTGEIEVHAFNASELVRCFEKIGEPIKDFDDLKNKVAAINEERLQKFIQEGLVLWHHKQVKEQMLYIPAGWVCCERVSSGAGVPSVYALRKSYFFNSRAATEGYKQIVQLMKASGRDVAKMEEVAQLISAGAGDSSA